VITRKIKHLQKCCKNVLATHFTRNHLWNVLKMFYAKTSAINVAKRFRRIEHGLKIDSGYM